jgi:hypothetical protein
VPAGAQQVSIQHQDVACIVAGQFPVLDACFRPGPGLAQARVYFRPEGVTTWYYVNAAGPAPPRVGDPADLLCRRTTLPKPKKSLIEKHIEYYVDATGKKQESSQTEVFRPLVVKSEDDCKKKLIAPWVPNAVVQVFPSMPAAFTLGGGGLSGIAVAGVVGAGVAGTGAVIVATGGGGESGPATTTAPVTTLPPLTVPTTTATTTLPPATGFNPIFKAFKAGVLQPDKIVGTEPVQVRFFMCESSGPLPLNYTVLVNGGPATVGCDTTITFTTGGFTPGFGGVTTRGLPPPAASASYDVLMQIQSDGPGNNPKANRALTVDVTGGTPTTTTTTMPTTTTTTVPTTTTTTTVPTTTTTTSTTTTTTTSTTTTTTTLPSVCLPGDTAGPTLTALGPPGGSIFHDLSGNYPVPFRVNATDPSGVASVDFKIDMVSYIPSTGPLGLQSLQTVFPTGNPVGYDWPFTAVQALLGPNNCSGNGFVVAVATDTCGNFTTVRSTGVISVRKSVPPGCPTTGPVSDSQARPGNEVRPQSPEQRPVTWVSQLDVPGGRGQIVLNGSEALFPAAGRVPLSARPRAGDNRVEAQLVKAEGRAGLWRFELAAGSTVAGSLRVISGEVALVTGDAVVFRLKGQPGERVVFTFRNR